MSVEEMISFLGASGHSFMYTREDGRGYCRFKNDAVELLQSLTVEVSKLKRKVTFAERFAENTQRSNERSGEVIETLKNQLQKSEAMNEVVEVELSAVYGWRENDHPEWFCRRTAEYVADLARAELAKT